MENEFIDLPVNKLKVVSVKELVLPKAKDFALGIAEVDNFILVNCLLAEEGDGGIFKAGDEIIVFDTAVEVNQQPVNDIRYTERIAILFTKADSYVPPVFALRASFPKVLHRISLYFERPLCLCIYELPYEDLKLEWRPQRFLQDIRTWLALTAQGKLHQEDQPLEPFIVFSGGTLILPSDLKQGEKVSIHEVSNEHGRQNLIVNRTVNQSVGSFHFMHFVGEPQEHGVIDFTPRSIFDLHLFLLKAGINLYNELQSAFRGFSVHDGNLKSRLLLMIQLPKKRAGSGVIELDTYAFLSNVTIETIGIALNVWSKDPDGKPGQIFPFIEPDNVKTSALIMVVLTPVFQLSKIAAQKLSGYEDKDRPDVTITQIGVGALGSQLFMNLAKTGFGTWKLLDSDIFLPHNTVRHILNSRHVGHSKVRALITEVSLFPDRPDFLVGRWDNYLHPSGIDETNDLLYHGEIILDTSASVAVARDLAFRTDIKGRRISFFLNPTGTDLIVLSEDADRKFKLDILEFQYYRALISDPALSGHLMKSPTHRYSTSCRDITSQIPQDYVAMHSAIGSAKLKRLVVSPDAEITIWRTGADLATTTMSVPVSDYKIIRKAGWDIYIDQTLLEKISRAREEKLPNETGGILIGGHDFQRKRIYLVDTILSPRDSEEAPDSYIRGIVGVKEKLKEISGMTADHLRYAGEWHSHPRKYSLRMSGYDEILFAEIANEMSIIGFPPLMLILGDEGKFKIYTELTD